MSKTMQLGKSKTYSVSYEVWFGPKEMSKREVKSFQAEGTSSVDTAFKKAENDALAFFKKKEKEGMHVDVIHETSVLDVERVRITPSE